MSRHYTNQRPVMRRALRAKNPAVGNRALRLAGRVHHSALIAAWDARGIRHNCPVYPNTEVV